MVLLAPSTPSPVSSLDRPTDTVPPAPIAPLPLDATGAQAPARPSRAVALSRVAALLTWAALVGLCLGWELVWAPTGQGTLALKVLPLLAAAPGLWRLRLYTYRWLSLAVWLYVAEGAIRLGDAGLGRSLAAAEMLLSVLLFAACAAHVRFRLADGRALRAAAAGDPSSRNP